MMTARPLYVALLAAVLCLAGVTVRAADLTISCGAVGRELELCREAVEAWAADTGNTVSVVSTPASATERLALYQQLLSAGSTDVDVLQIDIIWPGLLHRHLLDLSGRLAPAERAAHLPAAMGAATVDGHVVAIPWFIDVGLLYYRRDLLDQYGGRVPHTWEALAAASALIQAGERAAGNERMWGYVWQGRAYEGLTCNALEWVASFGGGTIVDADGGITVNNPRAALALDTAASWVDRISPPGVLNYQEEEARALFQSGSAVFMRNWPYAWALLNGADSPVAGRVGVAPLPRGPEGRSAGTLGGQLLAVSRYSRAPDAAVDLVRYLTGSAEQRRRAETAAFNPTRTELYDDAGLREANPFFAEMPALLAGAVARPAAVTGRRYNQVSSDFWSAAHATLAGTTSGAEALATLDARLRRLSRGGRW